MIRSIALALIGVTIATTAVGAQTTTAAPDDDATKRFLALDLAAGVIPAIREQTSEGAGRWAIKGWNVDGTVRLAPWFGVVGSVVKSSSYDRPAVHALGGVRVMTRFFAAPPVLIRPFAHVLVGRVSPRDNGSSGNVLVAGGGWDLLLLRVQFDYIGTSVAEVDAFRALIGAVVPLCFSRCRDSDGFALGK